MVSSWLDVVTESTEATRSEWLMENHKNILKYIEREILNVERQRGKSEDTKGFKLFDTIAYIHRIKP
jgi:hypothetical protein